MASENESKNENGGIFSSTKSDENSVFLNKSSIMKITKSFINKTGDTATSGDGADFYGVNSAVLVKDKSQLTIEDCEIVTNSKGSNGIFVTNAESSGSSSGESVPLDGNGLAEGILSGCHTLYQRFLYAYGTEYGHLQTGDHADGAAHDRDDL